MKAIFSLLLLLFAIAGEAAAAPIIGTWSGTAIRGGESRSVTLTVERSGDGYVARYAIPSLQLEGMPLTRFAFDEATGAITTARGFRGRLENGRITGELAPALIHGAPATLSLARSASLPTMRTRERDVQFTSRGFVLRGRLIAPARPGRHPAMVSLHGSGPSTRWLALSRARRFAEAGYAMLIFDKPGSGESQGDWTTTSLDEMAEDGIAALSFLRAQPEVDPRRTGLWGHSQAGQVISRAAALSNDIAFAIVLAGGGVTPREIEDYGYLGRLRHAGASPAATARAMAWVCAYYDYVGTGLGYDALAAQLTADPEAEWVRALGVSTVYPTVEQQPKWRWVATYDPAADIRRMRMPVLLLFASADENTPAEASLRAWRAALAAGGNRRVEWRMFAGADHHFLVPPDAPGWPSLAPRFQEIQVRWLNRLFRRP